MNRYAICGAIGSYTNVFVVKKAKSSNPDDVTISLDSDKLDEFSKNFAKYVIATHDTFFRTSGKSFCMAVSEKNLVDTMCMLMLFGVEKFSQQCANMTIMAKDVPKEIVEVQCFIVDGICCVEDSKNDYHIYFDSQNIREQIQKLDIPNHDCVVFIEKTRKKIGTD